MPAQKFRKKPVVIEAMQWNGSIASADEIEVWSGGQTSCYIKPGHPLAIYVSTLEGEMRCRLGDWIIKGIKSEFYPCERSIFDMTYEPAE